MALGRDSNQGGLLNTLEDNLAGYNGGNYAGQPTHTEWNTDGWADLSNVTTRTYQNFQNMRQSFPDNDEMVGAEIVMHDTLNDKYYTFKFDRWSVGDNGGDGGFGYVRRLINHTQYFTKTNYGNELDSIDTGLVITRGNNGGIYNDESEGDHNSDVSPQGTEWNIDGWSDLSNLLTRTYTNFTSAFSYQVGQRILGKEAIMHDTINDKYYAVKFLQWTQNNNGGGFTWQRRLIDTTQLDEGLHFADGTVQTTAGITLNSDGSFELPGGLVLPYQSTTGYRIGYTLNGQTLRLGNDSENEVIVTGPAATENNTYAQRIVIQGQRGYGSTSTQGEGGDIYIWGGIGGEFNGNTDGWNPGGGSGGDVKLRGGEGINNEGGYVRIEGGNIGHFNTTTTGNAGFVEINGGDVIVENAAGSSYGGNVRITGGRAYSATTQSGVVQVITGGISNGDVVGDKIWTFGNDGLTTFPDFDGTKTLWGAVDEDFSIRTTRTDPGSDADIDIYAADDLRLYAEGDELQLYANSNVLIFTDTTNTNHLWTFGQDGGLTFPDSTVQTTAYVDNRTTGSWTLDTGANTVSITVPLNGNYQMWVNGNIDNGLVEWNATVNVSNPNVPAIGSQYAWYYDVGNMLVLTAIPDQIIGTMGVISTSSSYVGSTANVFEFGITNNSTSTQVVTWGYTTL